MIPGRGEPPSSATSSRLRARAKSARTLDGKGTGDDGDTQQTAAFLLSSCMTKLGHTQGPKSKMIGDGRDGQSVKMSVMCNKLN